MSKKLLIVDDDKNVAEVIQESLAELFEVIDRSLNVDSALEFLQTSQYDLIILDINLDGLDVGADRYEWWKNRAMRCAEILGIA